LTTGNLGDEKKTDDLDDASGGPENGAVTNAGCDGLNGLDGGEIDERDLQDVDGGRSRF